MKQGIPSWASNVSKKKEREFIIYHKDWSKRVQGISLFLLLFAALVDDNKNAKFFFILCKYFTQKKKKKKIDNAMNEC